MKVMQNLILGCVIVICIAFFLPWVAVEAPAVGSFSKMLTGKRQAALDTISGFDVPILANGEESRMMISVIKIFSPDVKDADKKSWLIWMVPGLAVILFFLGRLWAGVRVFHLGAAVLGIAIFAVGTFKIVTTDLDKVVLNVKVAYGLWMVLGAYLALGLIHLALFKDHSKKA